MGVLFQFRIGRLVLGAHLINKPPKPDPRPRHVPYGPGRVVSPVKRPGLKACHTEDYDPDDCECEECQTRNSCRNL